MEMTNDTTQLLTPQKIYPQDILKSNYSTKKHNPLTALECNNNKF